MHLEQWEWPTVGMMDSLSDNAFLFSFSSEANVSRPPALHLTSPSSPFYHQGSQKLRMTFRWYRLICSWLAIVFVCLGVLDANDRNAHQSSFSKELKGTD